MAESVIQIKRKSGFTVIYNTVLRDGRLDLKAKGFFAVMMSYPDGWKFSIKCLCQLMGTKDKPLGRDSVKACLKQLEDAGYLRKEQIRGEHGKFTYNSYVLYDEPEQEGLLPSPSTEKPATAAPATEKPHQINTVYNKDCNNIPPISPTGEGEGDKSKDGLVPKHKPERFMKLWAIWPKKRRKARREAVKAWDRLKASDELLNEMSAALAKQMEGADWKRGIGVPYPSTWLNGRRWEDEPDEPEEEEAFGRQWADDPEVT